jgi:hypothetical protein
VHSSIYSDAQHPGVPRLSMPTYPEQMRIVGKRLCTPKKPTPSEQLRGSARQGLRFRLMKIFIRLRLSPAGRVRMSTEGVHEVSTRHTSHLGPGLSNSDSNSAQPVSVWLFLVADTKDKLNLDSLTGIPMQPSIFACMQFLRVFPRGEPGLRAALCSSEGMMMI